MKTKIIYFLLGLSVLSLVAFIYAYKAVGSVLDLSGYVLIDDKKVEGATVKLYENNVVVNKMITKSNSRFRFLLFSNNEYMVEVSKPGFFDERVYINTKSNSDMLDKYYFEFVVDLMNENTYKNVDASSLDFPTAIVKYDKGEDDYIHDKGYSEQVRSDLRKLNEQINKKK